MNWLVLHDPANTLVAVELQQLIGLHHSISMCSALSGGALDAIGQASKIVFIVTEDSVRDGSLALELLDAVRKRWPVARGRVIPVLIGELNLSSVPAYLAAVNLLRPRGPVEQIADLIRQHERRRRVVLRRLAWGAGWLVVLIALTAVGIKRWNDRPAPIQSARAAAEAEAWAREAATARGYRDVFVADRWIVGETPLTPHEVLVPLLVDGLRAQRPNPGDTDLLIALYSKNPRASFTFIITPGNLDHEPISFVASAPIPLGANSIESKTRDRSPVLGDLSIIDWMLSFAPYFGSLTNQSATWVCGTFSLPPMITDPQSLPNSAPVLRKVRIEPAGCPASEFPIYGTPPSAPFPPPLLPTPSEGDTAINQLRASFFLPRDTDSGASAKMDTLRIIATATGLAQDSRSIAMLLLTNRTPNSATQGSR